MADDASRTGVQFYADATLLGWLAKTHATQDPGLTQAFAAPTTHGIPAIMVGPSEAKLLTLLTRLVNAKTVVEVGTLAGYSAIALAHGLAPGGAVHTIEFDPKHAAIARQNIADAGLEKCITVHLGNALDILPALEHLAPLDVVFIDADKGNYDRYGEWAAKNIRPGGLLLGDNAFFFKRLLNDNDADAAAMRRFHEDAKQNFDTVCIPTPDGLLLGIKR